MDKYGIDNVRGGTYCRLELTSNEKEDSKRIMGSKMIYVFYVVETILLKIV